MIAARGSVLVVVLYAVGVASMAALSLTYRAGLAIREGRGAAERVRLEAMARSSVALAISRLAADDASFDHPGELWGRTVDLNELRSFSHLFASVSDGGRGLSSQAQVVDEASKLHVQAAATEDLEALGLSTREIASLLDWSDSDSNMRSEGAERERYASLPTPVLPKNAAPEAAWELRLIAGAADGWDGGLVDEDGVSSTLTLFGDGRVNLNTASESVLSTLPISEDAVERVALFRRYDEGSEGDVSEYAFRSVEQIEQLQGLSEEDRVVLAQLARYDSDVFRVRSVASGRLGGRVVREAIVRRSDAGVEVISWR